MKFPFFGKEQPPAPSIEVKERPDGGLFVTSVGNPAWKQHSDKTFIIEGYTRNPVVYACVKTIAQNAANVRIKIYKVDAQGNKMIASEQDPLCQLLKYPNSDDKCWNRFCESILTDKLLTGNAYIVRADLTDGKLNKPPIELWRQPTDYMKVLEGNSGVPYAYELQSPNGAKTKYPVNQTNGASDIMHTKTVNPSSLWYGASPMTAAGKSVDMYNEAQNWNKAMLSNGARPTGALSVRRADGVTEKLTPQQKNDLRQEIDRHFSGAQNSGRPMLLEGGMDWKEMGLNPKDMDYIEGNRDNARAICTAYGVPSQTIGIPGESTYSNMERAELALWEKTIIPWLEGFLNDLNAWLVPQFGGGYIIDYDPDNIFALQYRRNEQFDRIKDADFLTDNEKRQVLGFEPKLTPSADSRYKPVSSIPVDIDLPIDEEDALKFVDNIYETKNQENIPPKAAQDNAKKSLRWREQYPEDTQGAGTAVGWTRARQISKGEPLSNDVIKRMAQFNRHRENSKIDPKYKATPWKDHGYLSWLNWGGDEGVDWAIRRSKQIQDENADTA